MSKTHINITTMKLHEIIEKSESCEYIPFEEIEARKKQLNTYFQGYYNCKAIVIAWNVTNSGACTTLCPTNELYEGIEQVLDNYYSDLNEDEREEERELISFYSHLLEYAEKL